MTAILWDGFELGCDSQITDDNLREVNPTPKSFEVNGIYYAITGDLVEGLEFMRWHSEGQDDDDIPDISDFTVLVITKGKGEIFEDSLFACPVLPPVAMGHGRPVALGAYLGGASVTRSIEVACEIDTKCHLPVRIMKT